MSKNIASSPVDGAGVLIRRPVTQQAAVRPAIVYANTAKAETVRFPCFGHPFDINCIYTLLKRRHGLIIRIAYIMFLRQPSSPFPHLSKSLTPLQSGSTATLQSHLNSGNRGKLNEDN